MDPLSTVISLLRPHDCMAAGLDAGGDWSIRFDRHAGMKCNAVLRGTCWLSVEGEAEPVRLEAGDCVILPKGLPFLLSARIVRVGDDAEAIYAPVPHGGTATYGKGGDFFMTGSRFLLSGPAVEMLLSRLPSIILLRRGAEQEAVRWSLERIAEELRDPRPGGALSIAHLSHFVLVQALRRYLEEVPPTATGWMAALGDPNICHSVAAIHDDPARSWTVRELAARASMSRTSFAIRFRRVVGQTPMDYLTTWRMFLAAGKLRQTGISVARIAIEVGYASESAFTVAFKRIMDSTPRRYARQGNDIPPGAESAIQTNAGPDGRK